MKIVKCVGVLILFFTTELISIPLMLNFQGRLVKDGVPIEGEKQLTFRFYNTETGGSPLLNWSETQTVSVSKGVFNTFIGKNNPIPKEIFSEDNLYLEIEIEGEVLPQRQRIVSVAFAFMALDVVSVKDTKIKGTGKKVVNLNADLLDGKDSSEFALKGDYVKKTGDTMTGWLGFRRNLDQNKTLGISLVSYSNWGKLYLERYGNTNQHRLVITSGDDGDTDYILFRNFHYLHGYKDLLSLKRSRMDVFVPSYMSSLKVNNEFRIGSNTLIKEEANNLLIMPKNNQLNLWNGSWSYLYTGPLTVNGNITANGDVQIFGRLLDKDGKEMIKQQTIEGKEVMVIEKETVIEKPVVMDSTLEVKGNLKVGTASVVIDTTTQSIILSGDSPSILLEGSTPKIKFGKVTESKIELTANEGDDVYEIVVAPVDKQSFLDIRYWSGKDSLFYPLLTMNGLKGYIGINCIPSYQFDVKGDGRFTGSLKVDEINAVNGVKTGDGIIRIDSKGNLKNIGSISASGSANISGNTTISGELVVNKNTMLGGSLTVNEDLEVNSSANITGGSLVVYESAVIDDGVVVRGKLSVIPDNHMGYGEKIFDLPSAPAKIVLDDSTKGQIIFKGGDRRYKKVRVGGISPLKVPQDFSMILLGDGNTDPIRVERWEIGKDKTALVLAVGDNGKITQDKLLIGGYEWSEDDGTKFYKWAEFRKGYKAGVEVDPQDPNREIYFYSVEASKVALEDFGEATLKNGKVDVRFNRDFSLFISTPPIINITPLGKTKGLYISERSVEGFTVKKVDSEDEDISFCWRAIAIKKGFENFEQ